MVPVCIRSRARWRTEKAVSDLIAGSKTAFHFGNHGVQIGKLSDQSLNQSVGSSRRYQMFVELCGVKLRLQSDKAEPPAQGVVDHGQGAISSIHQTDEMDLRRNVEILATVEQRNCPVGIAFIGLD